MEKHGNPNPSPATRFRPVGGEALSRVVRGAKFPKNVDRLLAAMGRGRSDFIREAVLEKLKRDGLMG